MTQQRAIEDSETFFSAPPSYWIRLFAACLVFDGFLVWLVLQMF